MCGELKRRDVANRALQAALHDIMRKRPPSEHSGMGLVVFVIKTPDRPEQGAV